MSHNTTNHNIHQQQHSHNIHSTSSHQMQTLKITNTPAISSLTLLFINKSLNLDYISYTNIILNPLIIFATVSIYSLSIFIYILVIGSSYIEVITITICLVLSVFSLILYILIKYSFIIVKNIHLIEMLLLSCSFVIFSSLNQTISSRINNVSQYFISIEIIVKCMWIVFILNEFIFVLCGSVINILIVIGYNCKGSNNNNIAILVAFVLLDCSHIVFAYFITRLNKEWFICKKMKVGLAEKECAFMDFGYIRVNADVNTNVNVSVEERNEYVKKIFVDCDNEDVMDLLMEISDMNPDVKEKLIEIAKEKEKEEKEKRRSVCSSGNGGNNSKERESDFQTNDDLNFSNSNNNINQHIHNNASSIHFVNTSIGNHNTNNIKDNNSLHNDNNESSFVGELPQTIKSGAHSQILVTTTHTNTSQAFYHSHTPSQTHHHLSKPIPKFNKTTLSVNLNNKHRNKPSYNLNFDFLNKPSSNLINKPKPQSPHLPPPQQQQQQPLNITETNSYEHILTDINTLLPLLKTYLKSLCDFNFIYLGKRKINLKEYSPEPNQNTGIMTTRSVFRGAVENSPTDYTHYKIYLRYNPILNSIEFIFVDESKKEYENIFKTFSKQTSMYLHDFKNPLIAINEKIIEYKDVFESILLECGEQEDNNNNNNQIACFQYGQSEVDDFNFLSLTSNDCVGMIKSYEDFARAFSEGTEQMRLNLSFFPLNEVTKYLQDWMNMKIIHSHTHSELTFIINANSIPGDYHIYTDQLKLKRILINIISNSFKFTLSGSITLVISKESINCVPYLKFLIKDTGSGMNEVTLKNLFNPYCSNNDDKRNKEGCGLGLILAMRMSKSIGLGINVKSEVNKGTEMWFYCEERPKPLGLSKEEEESSRRLGSLRKKEEYIVDMENNNNNNNNTCLSSGRNNNGDIKHNCSLKLSLRSSTQNPPRIKDLLPSSKTLSTILNTRKIPNKHKLSINLHTTIHDDFLSMKRSSLENNKIPLSRNFKTRPTRKSQYMQHKQLLPLSQKSLVSVDFCDTTINDDYIMAISPNDKPVIINNNSLRLAPKSNSVICVSHNLPNNSNNTGKSTLIQQRPIQALHQITVNNNTINNYKQTLISGNANEESNISNLSIIKQEAAISIEGKNTYNNNILSQTLHAANASGMNCNRGLNVYNYHKTKSIICSSNLNTRSLISKKETLAKETLASACYTMGATSEHGGNGLKKVHSLGKNITVLVVDDDEHFQKSYKRVLEGLGVEEVVCINDGLDLLVMFLKGELNNFDAIIMDNFMTFVDGTEAVRVIKNMKDMGIGKKNILDYGVLNKIHIATSAQDLAMSSLEELSCIEFVEKPIGKEAMERIVKKCCVK